MSLSILSLCLRRRVVVHHTHLLGDGILLLLNQRDIVFFDDCLYSQYRFLTELQTVDRLQQLQVDCVLGFSSGLYADESAKSLIYDVESKVLHDACNKSILTIEDADRLRSILHEMNGFMKVSQLEQLLQLPFYHLALHGCCHLDLSKTESYIERAKLFMTDTANGLERLQSFGLSTDMYVYPYVFSFPMSLKVLELNGLVKIVGSGTYRLAIEDLASIECYAKCES